MRAHHQAQHSTAAFIENTQLRQPHMPLGLLLREPDLLLRVLVLLAPPELIRVAHTCTALRELTSQAAPSASKEHWLAWAYEHVPAVLHEHAERTAGVSWRDQCLLSRTSNLCRKLGERLIWCVAGDCFATICSLAQDF